MDHDRFGCDSIYPGNFVLRAFGKYEETVKAEESECPIG